MTVARITQLYAEAGITPENRNARITQLYAEAGITAENPNARVTQQYVEVASIIPSTVPNPDISSSYVSVTAGASAVIDKPTGVVEGTILLMAVTTRNAYISDMGGPEGGGWTLLHGVDVFTTTVTNPWTKSTNEQFGVWYKVAGASEPSTYSIPYTDDGTDYVIAHLVALNHVNGLVYDLSSPVSTTDTAASINITAPAFSVAFFGCAYDTSTPFTDRPIAWVLLQNTTNTDTAMLSAYREFTEDGPAGNITVQHTGVDDYNATVQIAFKSNTIVATPVIDPTSGEYLSSQLITITCDTPSSTIYYTENGSIPTTSSTLYTVPFELSSAKTIKAIAVASGMSNSEIATEIYTVFQLCETPIANPTSGEYLASQTITLSCGTPSSTIYYTTDGSDPDNTDIEYTVPISISHNLNIKAIAYAAGYDPSLISDETYTISQVALPVINPSSGEYAYGQSIGITCSTVGSTIYYTTNGVDPTSGDTEYTGLITLTEAMTLKAIAVYTDYRDSDIESAVYTILFIPIMVTIIT